MDLIQSGTIHIVFPIGHQSSKNLPPSKFVAINRKRVLIEDELGLESFREYLGFEFRSIIGCYPGVCEEWRNTE